MSGAESRGWSELRLHAWLAGRAREPQLAGSAQHDAAVLHRLEGRPVLCCDQVVLGVHAAHDVCPSAFGAKAVLRTLSDLAATAAQPLAVTLAARLEPERDEAWIRGAIEGAADAARRHGAGLIAGDLSAGPGPAGLAVTALGALPGDRTPPGRDRARAGQVLLCTGPLGGSRLGRHLAIEPRIAAGRRLWELGASALIDVSDGLQLDADRLGRASAVCAVLERVPVHPDAARAAAASGRSGVQHALLDGEDHELLATLEAADAARFLAEAAQLGCPGAARIGRIEAPGARAPGVWLQLDSSASPCRPAELGGYVHGGDAPSSP